MAGVVCLHHAWVLICIQWLVFGAHALSAIFEEERCSFISSTVCRWAEVQVLVDGNSLLFYASDAQSKASRVIKYVTQYGHEVHQLLSDAGLAPILYQLVQLPGGFMQVSPVLGQFCRIFIDQMNSCHVLCPCYLPPCAITYGW